MAITVNHPFVSAKGDGSDATLVRPSNWNASHDIKMATNKIIGRLTAGPGLAEELPVTSFMMGLLNTADFAALAAALGLPTTGDAKLTFKSTSDPGWVLANDGTIGDATSGATLAHASTEALFGFFYNGFSDAICPLQTSTGGATTRVAQGTSVIAYGAHCRMVLPKTLGRALIVGGAGVGLTNRVVGSTGGEETHTMTLAELVAHTHTQQGAFAGSGTGSGSISGSGSGSCSGTSDFTDRGLNHRHHVSGTTDSMNRSNPHSHPGTTMGYAQAGFDNGGQIAGTNYAYGAVTGAGTSGADINHEHGVNIYSQFVYGGDVDVNLNHKHGFSGSASVTVSGSCSVTTVNVSTTISGQTAASTGTATPFNVMQPWTAWNVMIKL